MAKLITVYWRDIPAQVMAKKGRTTAKVPLSDRFAEAIDRAAMRADKGGSDAYLAEWRRDAVECDENLQQNAQAVAEELEQLYDKERLVALVKNNGFEPQ